MEHVQKTIDDLVEAITRRDAENSDDKRVVNRLCIKLGKPEMYTDIDAAKSVASARTVKRGQFAGESAPASAARAFLAFIGKESGGATVDEICDGLSQGGFAFNSANPEARKTGLRVAMGKDVKIVFIGNETWGLAEWWPGRPAQRKKPGTRPGENGGDAEDARDTDDEGRPAEIKGKAKES